MSLGFLTCCGIRGLIRLHQEMHTYALGNGYMIYIYIYIHTKKIIVQLQKCVERRRFES